MAATAPHPGNGPLPAPLTPFVGRTREVAAARALLLDPTVRLLTLTGPGGVGKTRLALQLLAETSAEFDDRVLFVALASITDASLVVPTIAQALDVRDEGGDQPLLARLMAVLRLRPLLLVLDNFEQVIDAAPAVANVLVSCPDLKVLITSQMALRIAGEQEFPVPPLRVADLRATTLCELAESEAVTLFVQRARAVRPDFQLTVDNAGIIAAICRRLDGLPLAIELAAARSKLFSPRALLARLDQRLEVLTSGPRDAPPRLQTMRSAIAWSYDLLGPSLQRLFAQLAVFVDGWTLAAADVVVDPVLGADLDDGVLGGVAELLEHSLIESVEEPEDEPRFRMLETIREYALEQLDASSMAGATRWRHAAWCSALVHSNWLEAMGAQQPQMLRRTIREMANLRSAMAWALDQPNSMLGEQIVANLGVVWLFQGPWSEGRRWMERAIARSESLDAVTAGPLYCFYALNTAAAGDLTRALPAAERGHALLSSLQEDECTARGEIALGFVALSAGEDRRAETLLTQALERLRRLDLDALAGIALNSLGRLAYQRGEIESAIGHFDEALRLQRGIENHWGQVWPLRNLANIAVNRGELDRAAAYYADSLTLGWQQVDHTGSVRCLRGLADVALAGTRHEYAAIFLAATQALAEATGSLLSSGAQERFERVIAQTREALGPQRFDASWAEGRSLSIEQLVDVARTLVTEIPAKPRSAPSAVGVPSVEVGRLSSRELDVLRLIAAGQSTAEIAAQLYLSPRTVTTHLSSIYSKLGFNTRAAAARFAVEQHLV